jgi:hypothetical protein
MELENRNFSPFNIQNQIEFQDSLIEKHNEDYTEDFISPLTTTREIDRKHIDDSVL